VLLRAELPEEGDLVHAGLARDRARRRALEAVARENARGCAEQKLPCRGAPA
jgi:hypothetical protein